MGSSISFDRIAHAYDETRGGEVRGQAHAGIVGSLLPVAGRVLEVGVGTGLVALGLRAAGFDVCGVDISAAMLSRAVARLGQRVVVADAAALPVGTGAVDAAYSVWVLHLVGDRAAVFREVRRAVADGGRYVVVGAGGGPPPGDEPMGTLLWRMRGAVRGHAPDDPAELASLAGDAGWVVESATASAGEEFRETPREAIDRVRARTWSALWDLDDATWERAVEPALRELAALPDQDEPRVRRSHEHILVLA